ncbi:MAG: CDGSH iron-sulfur domain-containing protein [Anaerolineae bacterium]
MAPVKILARQNGPYVISGSAGYVDAEGNRQTTPGTSVALCRCGGSANKPFCDGTHRKNNFEAAQVELLVKAQ